MTSTTVGKLNFSRRKRKRTLGYKQEIDRAIIDFLCHVEKSSNGELKRRIEEVLQIEIPPKTWDNHLKRMVSEHYLIKEDTGERTEKVFYSVTEEAKVRRDLKLLTVDPKHVLFQQIYANLFLRAFIDGSTYARYMQVDKK